VRSGSVVRPGYISFVKTIRPAANCLRYVIMFRPPAREISLNTLEHVYHTCKFSLYA
jgi:hypothetical protein